MYLLWVPPSRQFSTCLPPPRRTCRTNCNGRVRRLMPAGRRRTSRGIRKASPSYFCTPWRKLGQKTLWRGLPVNAGVKMRRQAGVKIHHGLSWRLPVQINGSQTQLSSSINEPASPSRPGITAGTARSVGDGRSGATRSTASMASTGPSPQ